MDSYVYQAGSNVAVELAMKEADVAEGETVEHIRVEEDGIEAYDIEGRFINENDNDHVDVSTDRPDEGAVAVDLFAAEGSVEKSLDYPR